MTKNDNNMSNKCVLWSRKLKWIILTHPIPYIAKEMNKVIEETNYILGILLTEYTQPNKHPLSVLDFSSVSNW